ncbi:MAG: hypothetical protein HQL15_10290 [Candidatus Omnitrophica bacterium]|nr:hypothetical protein [Candidatus Omnitrophota bacterium]
MLKRGQSLLEYSILIVIILAVFLVMQNYVKRGVQGRWKSSVDDMGDQYDPRTANRLTNSSITSVSNSIVDIKPLLNGYETIRTDTSSTIENKTDNTAVESH